VSKPKWFIPHELYPPHPCPKMRSWKDEREVLEKMGEDRQRDYLNRRVIADRVHRRVLLPRLINLPVEPV